MCETLCGNKEKENIIPDPEWLAGCLLRALQLQVWNGSITITRELVEMQNPRLLYKTSWIDPNSLQSTIPLWLHRLPYNILLINIIEWIYCWICYIFSILRKAIYGIALKHSSDKTIIVYILHGAHLLLVSATYLTWCSHRYFLYTIKPSQNEDYKMYVLQSFYVLYNYYGESICWELKCFKFRP